MKTTEQTPHGEAALIVDLQKKLDDCLDGGNFHNRNDLHERLYNIVAGVFMPTSSRGKKDNWELWFNFRQQIFANKKCEIYFPFQDFRDVVNAMNRFIDDLGRDAKDPYFLFTGSAEVLLNSTSVDGWDLALDALNAINGEVAHELDKYDIQNLRLSIQIFKKCAGIMEKADNNDEPTS